MNIIYVGERTLYGLTYDNGETAPDYPLETLKTQETKKNNK